MNYTNKVDVWSAGVVLFAMLSGTFPFHPDNSTSDTLDDQIKKGKFRLSHSRFNHVSESAKNVIRVMLLVNPLKRWDLELLLRHGWMRDPINNRRLEVTLESMYGPDIEDDDTLTEEMENVAINEAVSENIHLSKRPRLG